MSDLRDLQEILAMLQNQETLIGLMEEQQTENERLTQQLEEQQTINHGLQIQLEECRQQVNRMQAQINETRSLNEKLNNENRRLLRQIESWNSLQT